MKVIAEEHCKQPGAIFNHAWKSSCRNEIEKNQLDY